MQYISSVYQNQRYGPIGIYFRSSQIRSRSFNSSSKSKPSGVPRGIGMISSPVFSYVKNRFSIKKMWIIIEILFT